jgi:hypothetical protein
LWNRVYEAALARGEDPANLARTLIPPRDWALDRTNALVNRFAGTDNLSRRAAVPTEIPNDPYR